MVSEVGGAVVHGREKIFFPFQTFRNLSWALWLRDLQELSELSQVVSEAFAIGLNR